MDIHHPRHETRTAVDLLRLLAQLFQTLQFIRLELPRIIKQVVQPTGYEL